jgi:tetratricopeptide (TPR) repeat protein
MGRGWWRGCLVVALFLSSLRAASDEPWITLRSSHFELFTNAGERYTPGLLNHLEHLRSLFLTQAGTPAKSAAPVRVFAFRSAAEYVRYRRDETADAYYFGAPGRDYIVMTLTRPEDYRTAAHEYAHAAIHGAGMKLPLWLGEGIAEVFSTVVFQAGHATVGTPNPGRVQTLQRASWIPLSDIMSFAEPPSARKDRTGIFYAESWALAHMLMFSPSYSQRFGRLLADRSATVSSVYGISLAALEHDLRAWVARTTLPSVKVTPAAGDIAQPASEPLNSFKRDMALADLQLAIGHREEARKSYLRLEREFPANPEIQGALGRIALAAAGTSEALDRFGRAMSLGIQSAPLCYEFAVMAQNAGLPEADVMTALERAVALDPGMDDARYLLALAYMNSGRYRAALQNLQALRFVPQRRAFAYYTALAYTQNELGMREEANKTAAEAQKRAHTEEEAEHARDLAWMASSEIVVQMTGDRLGQLRRVPSKSSALENWNPFIEPGDRIQREEGVLRDVDCSGDMLRLTVIAHERPVVLDVSHPERVQLRPVEAGPLEFTCGRQDGRHVLVEYALPAKPDQPYSGILRGIRFLP